MTLSMLPIISVTDLQRSTKAALASLKDYAVVQSRGKDVGLLLHPTLGRIFLQSDMLRQLLEKYAKQNGKKSEGKHPQLDMHELDRLIGNVILELSKK